ncbi:hypothetical protein Bca52824_091827 [Brassica carinata]|uniref:Large ribosomal subunit protein bL12 C-terminal domain-containing protein n=1 Tax=Brassica carinata TaxID=52824 RepID=A0A8X7NUC8_BRACI|nr:hypothetical protein Bca52824_091827 [Brassica carinata]
MGGEGEIKEHLQPSKTVEKKKHNEKGKRLWQRVKYQLVEYHALPAYLRDNEYIIGHYRSEWPIKQILLSIFTIHNETLNVWTHLIGFFLFLALTICTAMKVPSVVDLHSLQHRLPDILRKTDLHKLHSDLMSRLPSSPSKWHVMELLYNCLPERFSHGNYTDMCVLMTLNELSSPYGDTEQKLAYYFLQALFNRMTGSGERCYRTMVTAAATEDLLLRVNAKDGAQVPRIDGEAKIHIVDISSTFCTQWPTLLEALATRSDDTPHLRLTTVVVANKHVNDQTATHRMMKEIGSRMEKFARLMGFLLNSTLFTTWEIYPSLTSTSSTLKRTRIVTIVEEEADLVGEEEGFDDEFLRSFGECLRWFRVCFESLEESFPRTSNERLMLERVAGRAIVDLVACEHSESTERRETARKWSSRMRNGGFGAVGYSDEVADDVRALLRRYKEGVWSMVQCSDATGIFLCWRDQPVILSFLHRTSPLTAETRHLSAVVSSPEARTKNLERIADDLLNLNRIELYDYSILFSHKLGLNRYGSAVSSPAGDLPNASSASAETKTAEKTAFDVKLEKFDAASKIKVIKEIRAFTELGLKEAKDLVEKAPVVVKTGVTKEEAEKIMEKLKAVGATVALE